MADDTVPVESKLVEAVGIAVGHDGTESGISRAKLIETAMTAAVVQAQAEGVTDPDEIRARILAARDAASGS